MLKPALINIVNKQICYDTEKKRSRKKNQLENSKAIMLNLPMTVETKALVNDRIENNRGKKKYINIFPNLMGKQCLKRR